MMFEQEFAKKIFSGSKIEVPEVCKANFDIHFKEAKNSEWQVKADIYEVLFYKDNVEYIAEFDRKGGLLKYKTNLNKALLPAMVQTNLEQIWEIMNVVLINKRDHIVYEIIVRSSALERFRLIVDQMGEIVEEKAL